MPLLFFLAFILASFFWFVLPAAAQQPFYTDDTDVTPPRKLHLEFSNEFDWLRRTAFPSLRQNTASVEVNYGLLEGLEVGIESPLLAIFSAKGAHPRTVVGIGDTMLSAKWNFRKEREGSSFPAMSINLQVETPTGDAGRQLGSGLADVSLNGILQKSLTGLTKVRLNGGVLFSGNTLTGVIGVRTRGLVFTGGTSLVRKFTRRLDLGAEVTGALTRNFDLGKGQLQVLFGGNYALREGFTFDFGILGGWFVASPRIGAQLGFSFDF